MTQHRNRRVILAERATGLPTTDLFELVEDDAPSPGPGEVLINNVYVSADPGMKGRAALLKSLLGESKKLAKGKFVIRPVEIDRAAISKEAGDRKMGESVDGLGGFILEAEDGSVSFDMRFDNMLERAWSNQLSAVNETLFG